MSWDPKKANDPYLICPKCGNILIFSYHCSSKCEKCGERKTGCFNCKSCRVSQILCLPCVSETNQFLNTTSYGKTMKNYWFLILIILACFVSYYVVSSPSSSSSSFGDVDVMLKVLREKYPSQINDTWYNFLGVLENKVPTVKSIIFLHNEDKKTSDCLAKELVLLFLSDKSINFNDIYFSNMGYDIKDYGLVLEHYRPIVKRYRVLITDLTIVTSNIARIFHSLCDEVSSDIKPSLFIFTLKCDEKMRNLKPVERASSILRKAWYDLPQSEMSPLISRVVKNVIDVVPEKQVSC